MIGILDDDFTEKHTVQDQKGRWNWDEEARGLFTNLPKEPRHGPTPANIEAMKKMSDDQMMKIVKDTV